MAKKISDYIPILKDQGIDYIAAAPAAGVATQYQVVTLSGAPQTITLEYEMADTNYAVTASDNGGNAISIDNKSVTSFTADNSSGGSETANFIIVGQLKGQK